MPIDDTKKCICKPSLSGRNRKCQRCHPKKKVEYKSTKKKPVPAQEKKHKAPPVRALPWLSETSDETEMEQFDPYDDLERLIQ